MPEAVEQSVRRLTGAVAVRTPGAVHWSVGCGEARTLVANSLVPSGRLMERWTARELEPSRLSGLQRKKLGSWGQLDHARELENILHENNGKYITLDAECEDAKFAENNSRCGALIDYLGHDYLIFVTGRETFQEYWKASSDSVASSPIWLKFSLPDGVSARLANSQKGAGYLRVQGTFAILESTSGIVPPDAIYYELTAVNF